MGNFFWAWDNQSNLRYPRRRTRVLLGGMGKAFDAIGGTQPYTNAAGAALIFSLVGIVGGVLENRKIFGAALMIIGALGV